MRKVNNKQILFLKSTTQHCSYDSGAVLSWQNDTTHFKTLSSLFKDQFRFISKIQFTIFQLVLLIRSCLDYRSVDSEWAVGAAPAHVKSEMREVVSAQWPHWLDQPYANWEFGWRIIWLQFTFGCKYYVIVDYLQLLGKSSAPSCSNFQEKNQKVFQPHQSFFWFLLNCIITSKHFTCVYWRKHELLSEDITIFFISTEALRTEGSMILVKTTCYLLMVTWKVCAIY